ncbi:MAG: TRAP transporter substrate-binding protein DctP [Pseudomonadales bacterium]|nr:TRAP transporter substrate-binding protein DctP [Halieaceae bacterium]MCP5163579.1 TRAP transporter substrate-binding protein DctP [Pseudomonadales bacterium]MCP5189202.1 TRAP transporter substrate-binding protein DctP [Pseudomonadales bacterium]MCP5204537.1 TRAP transporter substrate-binding protein DctP [Pseudomonadales bacterium]
MAASNFERRFTPLIILLLVAALVVVIGLWASGRAAEQSINTGVAGAGVGDEHFHWKMVTTWPKNLPGLGSAAENFARYMDEMSGGRLTVHVYGAGEIVPAFEVFDAVSQGVADAGHGAAYYWKGKIPSAVFFTTVPFGLNAQEINGWLHYGGGLELWREAYAPFNIIPFAGGNTGVQMAGWFNREINSTEDLQGLKMRIPGLAGDVFAEAGGTAVRIPGGELYTSLQTGVIDATEWVGPYNDLALGLYEVAEYYYYPGWHEPGAMLELIVNRDSFEALPPDLQAMVTVAARAANQDMLDEFTARNNAALQDLVNNHGVKLRRLPDDVLQALYRGSEKAMRQLIAEDPLAARVYDSYKRFYDGARAYHHISEQAYINARDMVIDAEEPQQP